MKKVYKILLIPPPGDPKKLLVPGEHGAMPPIAKVSYLGGGSGSDRKALVLVSNGFLVEEGVDRLMRRVKDCRPRQWNTESRLKKYLKNDFSATHLMPKEVGQVVLLDMTGCEVFIDDLQKAQVYG